MKNLSMQTEFIAPGNRRVCPFNLTWSNKMAWKSRYRKDDRIQLGDVIDYLAYRRDVESLKLQQMQIARGIAYARAGVQRPATFEEMVAVFRNPKTAAAAEAAAEAARASWAQPKPEPEARPEPAPFTWKGFLHSLLVRGPDVFSKPKPNCGKKPHLRLVAKHLR
jgi:hypothetical protein